MNLRSRWKISTVTLKRIVDLSNKYDIMSMFLLFLIIKRCQTAPKKYKPNFSSKLKKESNKAHPANMI